MRCSNEKKIEASRERVFCWLEESMADSFLRAWWDRFRGRLEPGPCPYSDASVLEMPGRALVAGPVRVLTDFGIGSGDRVLEVGPGVGYYSVEAARRVGSGGRLLCLDLQREMLVEARKRVHEANLKAADFVAASATRLPFRSSSVDHVFLVTVLGEIPDRRLALAEFRRVLRPPGFLSVSEQLPDPDFVTRRTLRRELSAAGFVEERTRGRIFYTSTWRLDVAFKETGD
jgi:SAM-dependent methyltransferase